MPHDTQKAYLAAISQTVIIGLSFAFVKISLKYANPLDILAHRFTLSFVFASVPLLLGWAKLRIDGWRGLAPLLPLALFYPSLFFGFQVFGLVHTSTSEAGIIQATVPILTAVLATYFLKEHTGGWQLVAALVSVGGVILIFAMKGLQPGATSLLGSALILLSSLSLAAYSVMARKIGQKADIFSMTYVMLCAGFVLFNLLALGRHALQGELHAFIEPLHSWPFIGSMLYLGVLSSLVTAYLSNYALSKIEASQMSIFANLATLITIIVGILMLGERLEWYHIVGGVAILLGVIGRNLLPTPAGQ